MPKWSKLSSSPASIDKDLDLNGTGSVNKIMKALFSLIFSLLLLMWSVDSLSLAAKNQEGADPGKPVPITPIGPKRSGPRTSYTAFSSIGDRLRLVIRDSDAWREIWKRIHEPISELPPLPAVDFSHEMIVVAAMGSRPSGGYAIIIDSARELENKLEIVVRSVSPGKGCITPTVITAPVDVVKVPITERQVVFRETEEVNECK